jgi:hypothetical protein
MLAPLPPELPAVVPPEGNHQISTPPGQSTPDKRRPPRNVIPKAEK